MKKLFITTKSYIVLYLIFSVIYILGGVLNNIILQDVFDLLGGLILCIIAFYSLRHATSFHRFLYWIAGFIWTDYFCSLLFTAMNNNYISLPEWFNLPIDILFTIPSILLILTSIEIIYLIRQRLDFKFYFLNLFGVTLFIAVLVYGVIDYRIPTHLLDRFYDLPNLFDSISLVLLLSLLASIPPKQLHRSIFNTLVGIALLNVIDLTYIFSSSISNSDTVFYVWAVFYTVCPLILIYSLLDITKNPGYLTVLSQEDADTEKQQLINKIRFQALLCLLSFLLLWLDYIAFPIFSYLNLILLIYFLISNSYLVSIQNQQDILKHRKLTDELEETVKQKSIDILKQNIKLQELANHDYLTNAYNRRYFQEILSELSEDAEIYAIDILQFNAINQIYGESVGDEVLIYLFNTLQKTFPNHSIFRVDSNEFVVLFRGGMTDVNAISHSIFEALKEPYRTDYYQISIQVGIGIAGYLLHTKNGDSPDSLLNKANFALSEVKLSNTLPRIQVFDQTLADKKFHNSLIQSLLDSINYDEEMVLYYQPQYTADGESLIGVEALVRWFSPILGFVSPAEFIPIAEESSTIIKIVDWTLQKACSQINAWNTKYHLNLKVGINISPKYIELPNFYQNLERVAKQNQLNVNWIDLEITETSLMHLDLSVINLFEKLSLLGVSTSIDDFGTGYSSLSYIQNLKISTLKIAKELIDSLSPNNTNPLIVNAIIKMAQGLKIKTIAEGVETKEQAEILQNLGCDFIQGYYFGKPLPPEDFVKIHL